MLDISNESCAGTISSDLMVEYTIAICNYNEADSLQASLQSVLAQIDDRFEVLVVDDGSTDGSTQILERLDEKFDSLRTIFLSPSEDRKLGKTRTISVERAAGNHVILHVDTDNYYTETIIDFVEIYEQLREALGRDYYLLGTSFAATSRDFLLRFGAYRNLPVGGEDRDLWRRLAADDSLVVYQHEPLEETEKWEHGRPSRSLIPRIKRTFEVKIADFQVGFGLGDYLRWSLQRNLFLTPYHVLTTLISYLIALPRRSYQTPSEFLEKGKIDDFIQQEACTLRGIERRYNIIFDRSKLSSKGQERLDVEPGAN